MKKGKKFKLFKGIKEHSVKYEELMDDCYLSLFEEDDEYIDYLENDIDSEYNEILQEGHYEDYNNFEEFSNVDLYISEEELIYSDLFTDPNEESVPINQKTRKRRR